MDEAAFKMMNEDLSLFLTATQLLMTEQRHYIHGIGHGIADDLEMSQRHLQKPESLRDVCVTIMHSRCKDMKESDIGQHVIKLVNAYANTMSLMLDANLDLLNAYNELVNIHQQIIDEAIEFYLEKDMIGDGCLTFPPKRPDACSYLPPRLISSSSIKNDVDDKVGPICEKSGLVMPNPGFPLPLINPDLASPGWKCRLALYYAASNNDQDVIDSILADAKTHGIYGLSLTIPEHAPDSWQKDKLEDHLTVMDITLLDYYWDTKLINAAMDESSIEDEIDKIFEGRKETKERIEKLEYLAESEIVYPLCDLAWNSVCWELNN